MQTSQSPSGGSPQSSSAERASTQSLAASESNAILNAILNYTVDYKGKLPNAISNATAGIPVLIGAANSNLGNTYCPGATIGTGVNSASTTADLGGDAELVDEYISEIPVDPRGTNDTVTYTNQATGYYFIRSANGRIEVGSCNPESEDNVTTPTIKIKR